MKKRFISFFIFLIMISTIPSFCYSFSPTFKPKYVKNDDFIAYLTLNAATITLSNGQVVSNVNVIGGSKNESQVIADDVDIILIIDTSGSMEFSERIGHAKAASNNLVSKFFQSFTNSRIALISFSSGPIIPAYLNNYGGELSADEVFAVASPNSAILQTDFVNINNEDLLKEKINSLYAEGGTNLYAALELINDNNLSFSNNPNAKKAIITLTDGNTVGVRLCQNKYKEFLDNGYFLYNICLGGEYTGAFIDSLGNQLGELYTNVSTTELENIYNQIYDNIYKEVSNTSIDDSFILDCENAFFLDNNAHFTLDYELTQGALLTVEYLFDIKPNFNCTSIDIIDTIGKNFSYSPDSKLLTEQDKTNADQGWVPNNDSSQLIYHQENNTEYVIPKHETFQRKIVLTRILSVRSDDDNVFKNLIDFSVEGTNYKKEEKSFSTSLLGTEDKLDSTIYVVPPWGSSVNHNIINLLYIFLVVATFIIIIIIITLKRKT